MCSLYAGLHGMAFFSLLAETGSCFLAINIIAEPVVH